MNCKEAFDYIESAGLLGSKPGLDRINALCAALGNPQEKVRYIHIAGTNGKGSVAAMLSSILISAGYKTGLYTSPHLCRFEERIKICGADIPKRRLAGIIGKIKECADNMSDKPTEFEIATAAAFLYFYEEHCDIAVLETGLGGRLDATNVITAPVLSVITGIALDHTSILGDTVEKIAFEKGGIIKEKRPVVTGDDIAAKEVLKDIAAKRNAPFFIADKSRLSGVSVTLGGTAFDFVPYGKIKLSLSGAYQAGNACSALTAVEVMRGEGFKISEKAIRAGLLAVRWPARFEVLSKRPLIIYDGAHNPQGAALLKEALGALHIEKAVFLSGAMRDKDYAAFAGTLTPLTELVFTVKPDNPRALEPE
ncbi:MAG: bifunctional folylpolyglutamate synthase/dihydrofolate synthase, partial [Clostridia bacterium]|nr:bifunctional folylpolyglutamate synthase/dihydrofolate synthase [Clostridia bacterium]